MLLKKNSVTDSRHVKADLGFFKVLIETVDLDFVTNQAVASKRPDTCPHDLGQILNNPFNCQLDVRLVQIVLLANLEFFVCKVDPPNQLYVNKSKVFSDAHPWEDSHRQ